MKAMRSALGIIGVMVLCSVTLAQSQPIGFDGAKWIWPSFGSRGDLGSMSAGVGYFRTEITVPESPALKSAEVIITADNLFVLYLNGQSVGGSEADNSVWHRPKRWDVTGLLVPGRTVVAVEPVNTQPP
jgi:hypothetical protein